MNSTTTDTAFDIEPAPEFVDSTKDTVVGILASLGIDMDGKTVGITGWDARHGYAPYELRSGTVTIDYVVKSEVSE